MFESKLNIYYTEKLRKKYFDYLLKKYEKGQIKGWNTSLKLSCEFVNN